MADIKPFQALRFDTTRLRLEDVLTQPYDKISPAMQAGYYQRSPHNLIRFELARPSTEAGAPSIYEQSANFLAGLQRDGILQRDAEPGLYAYVQHFSHPLNKDVQLTRSGIIALGKLYDYDEQVVFRHEQTLSGPKADRMNLLRHTRTHSGQIFMLYDDPARAVDHQVERAIAGREPDASVVDEYGVENFLWRISDPALVGAIVENFREQRLIIADGHHRYETARSYRDAQRQQHGNVPAAHDYVMMTLVNMSGPGLLVLPTHRVVFGLDNFDTAALVAKLRDCFEVASAPAAELLNRVNATASNATALGLATSSGAFVLKAIPDRIDRVLSTYSAVERRVDVTILHKVVLESVLGISEEAIREQRNLRYYRSAEKALHEVESGANAAFLLNPVSLEQLRQVCYASHVMPQKSTDFYPKLLSGITLYNLDRCF